jgi:uncharacterized RmlC-like cupin family protein
MDYDLKNFHEEYGIPLEGAIEISSDFFYLPSGLPINDYKIYIVAKITNS